MTMFMNHDDVTFSSGGGRLFHVLVDVEVVANCSGELNAQSPTVRSQVVGTASAVKIRKVTRSRLNGTSSSTSLLETFLPEIGGGDRDRDRKQYRVDVSFGSI